MVFFFFFFFFKWSLFYGGTSFLDHAMVLYSVIIQLYYKHVMFSYGKMDRYWRRRESTSGPLGRQAVTLTTRPRRPPLWQWSINFKPWTFIALNLAVGKKNQKVMLFQTYHNIEISLLICSSVRFGSLYYDLAIFLAFWRPEFDSDKFWVTFLAHSVLETGTNP